MRVLVRVMAWSVLVAILLGVSLLGRTWVQTVTYRKGDIANLPPTRVAIVFGAFADAAGRPSDILRARIDGAIALYEQGIVQRILMSGDNSTNDYNEVSAMYRYALSQGVPETVLAQDFAGFSTYDTCSRARQVFDVREAILVTQRYHSARAVYTCRVLGIDATAYALPDVGAYPMRYVQSWALREVGATMNAYWELHITRPGPKFLGALEGPL
jgi:vancomycin permeability regulator SanA